MTQQSNITISHLLFRSVRDVEVETVSSILSERRVVFEEKDDSKLEDSSTVAPVVVRLTMRDTLDVDSLTSLGIYRALSVNKHCHTYGKM